MNAENTVHPTKPSSPFFSMFHKKRQPSAPPTATIEEFEAFPPMAPRSSAPPLPSKNGIHATATTLPPTNGAADALKRKGSAPTGKSEKPPQLSFVQRVKLHKGIRTGKLPFDLLKLSQSSQNLPPTAEKAKKDTLKQRNKAFSADAINELDPVYLTEALLAIGDEQPIVARSTPKHAVVYEDERKKEERLRRNCIYEPEVYDKMLSDSLKACDIVQSNLSDFIVTVRAKSPTPKPKSPTPYLPPPVARATTTSPFYQRAATSVPASPVPEHRSSVSMSSSAVTRKADSVEPAVPSRSFKGTEPLDPAKVALSPSVLRKKAQKRLQFAE